MIPHLNGIFISNSNMLRFSNLNNVINLENILISGEPTFSINGHDNTQNCRYWTNENPQKIRELHTQYSENVNVWTVVIAEYIIRDIIGTFFVDGYLNGVNYSPLLQNNVPTLANLYLAQANHKF